MVMKSNTSAKRNFSCSGSRVCIPEQRITSYFPRHGSEGGCSCRLCCKFGINLRLFAIWLVVMKSNTLAKKEFSCSGSCVCIPEQRITSYFSQHGIEGGGCSCRLYCKFGINLRLFAIWLAAMKSNTLAKKEFSCSGSCAT